MVCPPTHDGFAIHPTANPHFPPAHSSHPSRERGSKALKFLPNLLDFYAKVHFFLSCLPAFSQSKDEDEKKQVLRSQKKRESLIEMSDSRRKKGGMKGEIVRIIFGTNASLI